MCPNISFHEEPVIEERVIVVDENDVQLGTETKMAAHRKGVRHRAFSIFVFNERGELLLQQRAGTKYHSRSLWSNTCCGHPRPDESVTAAAHRRIREEMGFDCPLGEVLVVAYEARLEDGMIENEIDHILVGEWEQDPDPDPTEAQAWRWTDLRTLTEDLQRAPERYTAWFSTILEQLMRSGMAGSRG